MVVETLKDDVKAVVARWKDKRGNLIMVLHDIQDRYGYVPREAALEVSRQSDMPLARIYEVLTFYNYFKLLSKFDIINFQSIPSTFSSRARGKNISFKF